jgi:hypothetical protein
MATEDGDDPAGMLQGPAKLRHSLRRFEVDGIRAHRDLKGRMMRENRNRSRGLGVDHVDQMLDAHTAKFPLVA